MNSQYRLKLKQIDYGQPARLCIVPVHTVPGNKPVDNFTLLLWFVMHTQFGETAELMYGYMKEMGID